MKAIIPTGGRGTRMQPLTFSANKHFIPVANKPLIFYPIETVVEAGIKEILITYNPGGLDIAKAYLGDGKKWGVKITYVMQEEPKGLANIIQSCEQDLQGDSFVLHLGDNIFNDGIKKFVEYFHKHKPNGLLPMVEHEENTRLGVPYFDKKNRLYKYVEKPKNPPHKFAVPGLYFADNNAFKCFTGKDQIRPSARGEFEIPSVFQWLVDHNYKVEVLEYEGKWLDPGKFGDWIESNQYLLDNNLKTDINSKIDSSNIVEGRIQIGKNCRISDSEIRGPVAIGDNVIITSSYIGPYTSVSNDCVIQNSHIENTVLMESVQICDVHKPIDRSLIGAGTKIEDSKGITDTLEFFVGAKCEIKI